MLFRRVVASNRLTLPATALSICVLAGCARAPVNAECNWPPEAPLVLDLNSPDTMRHLILDAQLAEELAIRFADAERERRTGVSGDGGLLERRQVIEKCRKTLFVRIANAHQVPIEMVVGARTERPPVFDATVLLSFGVVYGLLASAVMPIVFRRVSPDGRWPTLTALLFGSLVAGAAGLLLGELWAMAMEIVREGNDHLDPPAFRIPWGQHRAVVFGVGVAGFWIILAMRAWIDRRRKHQIVARSHRV